MLEEQGTAEGVLVALFMDNKPIVEAMDGSGRVNYRSLRPLFVCPGRVMYNILKATDARKYPGLRYIGMSPLRWTPREYNKQADYLCHYTLGRKSERQEVSILPCNFALRPGDLLGGWSDGGFHEVEGGTAYRCGETANESV